MKKTNRQTKSKMSVSQSKRFDEAKISYEKMLQEVAPFVPRVQAKEVTTAGKWQNTSTLSFY